jgi:glucuronide carrier protein
MFTPDFAEYGMFKTGVSAFGLAFSIQTFSTKLINALTGALAGFALTMIGFVVGEGAVQNAGFTNKLWFAFSMAPNFFILASVPFFLTYKLRDKHVAIMAKANRGEITREEAEKLIDVKL